MKQDLKLRVRIQEQQMTLWQITRIEASYIMFRATITSGKKNPDGTWDNINQSFTCFANGDNVNKIQDGVKGFDAQKIGKKIKITGSLTMLPEKRSAMGKNGEYQESIFSNATINVDAIEFLEDGASGYANNNYEKAQQSSYSAIDDDIPF